MIAAKGLSTERMSAARGFEADAAISAITEMVASRENTTDALDDQ